jgi:hypothetical protein
MIHDSRGPDPRRALLVAALGFARCREVQEPRASRGRSARGEARARAAHAGGVGSSAPEIPLSVLRAWLSSWRGIGLVAGGMARQGYDLSLTRYADFGWRATFYVTGREHSPTGATGSAFEATPFRAVQAAAWETLARA